MLLFDFTTILNITLSLHPNCNKNQGHNTFLLWKMLTKYCAGVRVTFQHKLNKRKFVSIFT